MSSGNRVRQWCSQKSFYFLVGSMWDFVHQMPLSFPAEQDLCSYTFSHSYSFSYSFPFLVHTRTPYLTLSFTPSYFLTPSLNANVLCKSNRISNYERRENLQDAWREGGRKGEERQKLECRIIRRIAIIGMAR